MERIQDFYLRKLNEIGQKTLKATYELRYAERASGHRATGSHPVYHLQFMYDEFKTALVGQLEINAEELTGELILKLPNVQEGYKKSEEIKRISINFIDDVSLETSLNDVKKVLEELPITKERKDLFYR